MFTNSDRHPNRTPASRRSSESSTCDAAPSACTARPPKPAASPIPPVKAAGAAPDSAIANFSGFRNRSSTRRYSSAGSGFARCARYSANAPRRRSVTQAGSVRAARNRSNASASNVAGVGV